MQFPVYPDNAVLHLLNKLKLVKDKSQWTEIIEYQKAIAREYSVQVSYGQGRAGFALRGPAVIL